MREALLQRSACGIGCQVQRAGGGQYFATAQRVIHEQAKPDQPCGTATLHPRHQPSHQLAGGGFAFEPHVGVVG